MDVSPPRRNNYRPERALLRDMLSPMLEAERLVLGQSDHLQLASADWECSPNSVWREKVCQWMYDVTDHLRERRSIVYLAMNILDRYCVAMSQKENAAMCERSYEMASLSAIFLAMRIAGSVQVRLPDIIRMSRRGVTTQQLIDSGTDMVQKLTWDNRLLAPQEFITALLSHLPPLTERRSMILDGATYLSELAVCDACLSRHKASDVALAAFLNTVTADQGRDAKWTIHSIKETSLMDPDSTTIRELRSRLHRLYSLSYESIDRDVPHLISIDSESDSHRDFISSCATRTISEDNLMAMAMEVQSAVEWKRLEQEDDIFIRPNELKRARSY